MKLKFCRYGANHRAGIEEPKEACEEIEEKISLV